MPTFLPSEEDSCTLVEYFRSKAHSQGPRPRKTSRAREYNAMEGMNAMLLPYFHYYPYSIQQN
jgi:hypothetical protein